MAYCPDCQNYMSPMHIMTKPMVCPGCGKKVGFDKKEYKNATRPGVFIVLLLFFNIYYTLDPIKRLYFNMVVMILWGLFFWRFIVYLKKTQLVIKE